MAIPFKNLDVYAIVDQDTDEARAFTTYLGYWDCVAGLVAHVHGPTRTAPSSPHFGRTERSRPLAVDSFTGATVELRGLLLNAWNSEFTLYLARSPTPAERGRRGGHLGPGSARERRSGAGL